MERTTVVCLPEEHGSNGARAKLAPVPRARVSSPCRRPAYIRRGTKGTTNVPTGIPGARQPKRNALRGARCISRRASWKTCIPQLGSSTSTTSTAEGHISGSGSDNRGEVSQFRAPQDARGGGVSNRIPSLDGEPAVKLPPSSKSELDDKVLPPICDRRVQREQRA